MQGIIQDEPRHVVYSYAAGELDEMCESSAELRGTQVCINPIMRWTFVTCLLWPWDSVLRMVSPLAFLRWRIVCLNGHRLQHIDLLLKRLFESLKSRRWWKEVIADVIGAISSANLKLGMTLGKNTNLYHLKTTTLNLFSLIILEVKADENNWRLLRITDV